MEQDTRRESRFLVVIKLNKNVLKIGESQEEEHKRQQLILSPNLFEIHIWIDKS